MATVTNKQINDNQNGAKEAHADRTIASDKLPAEEVLRKIYELNLIDEDSKSIEFRDLIQHDPTLKTLVIFIRHFFCGSCQDYVRALVQGLPPSKLSTLSTTLCIIGSGDSTLISNYAKETECPFPIYTDPTRKLYKQLGFSMNRGLPKQPPEYIKHSFPALLFGGIAQGVAAGRKVLSGGKSDQNGGELLFVNGKLTFIHRMQNTQDHLELKDLEAIIHA